MTRLVGEDMPSRTTRAAILLLVLASVTAMLTLPAKAQSTWYVLGEEPDESSVSPWGGTQLDIVSVKASSDNSNIYFEIDVASTITAPSSGSLNWVIQLDTDMAGRASCSFGPDYEVYVKLYSDGASAVEVWDSSGNYVGSGSVVGGGAGQTYWEISVPLNLIGSPSAVYVRAVTIDSAGNTDDVAPQDNTGGNALGDWWIYYVTPPSEPTLESQSDASGDATSYYDILSVSSGLDPSNLFLKMSVNGQIPYYESGSTGAIYQFFIDADNNPDTGYQVVGVGAEYMVEYITGWVPKLYSYTGTGTDWSWQLVSCENYYPVNPGGGTQLGIIVPLSDFSTSINNPTISARTEDPGGNVKDTLDTPLPIPETPLIVVAAVLASLLAVVLALRRR